MVNVLTAVTGSTGLVFVVANVLAGQTGLPLPAVPSLIIAGALAANHYGWGAEVFVGAILACLLADSGWYLFGRKYGGRFMLRFLPAFATRQLREGGSRLPLERWRTKTFLVAKCIPGLAIVTSPLAGASRMSFLLFLWISAAGAALWVGACLLAGVLLHRQISDLLPRISRYGEWGICVVAVLLTGYMAVTWFKRRRCPTQA
jgi:membrane protein DedA with SNARE-associated domain